MRIYPLYARLGERHSSSVTEAVEEPAENAAFPGEGGAGRRCHGPLAGDRLVIVCPGDRVNDLGLAEVLGAVDLRHVADQDAVAYDLGFEARGAVGIPFGVAAAGQGDAHAELAYATSEKVCVDAAVTKGVDHPAGPEFVHARKLALVPERSLDVQASQGDARRPGRPGRRLADDPASSMVVTRHKPKSEHVCLPARSRRRVRGRAG